MPSQGAKETDKLRTVADHFRRLRFVLLLVISLQFLSCKKDVIPTIHVENVYSGPSQLNSINFPQPETGYACGENGLILKSVDGGKTWMELPAINKIFNNQIIFFIDASAGFMGTDHGNYYTADGGRNWSLNDSAISKKVFRKYNQIHPAADLFFLDSLHGWQYRSADIRYFGYIFKTLDGGRTWERINTGQHNRVMDAAFADGSNGFAVGKNTILVSADGGSSWEALRTQEGTSPGNYSALTVIDKNSFFAVEDGKIDRIYR